MLLIQVEMVPAIQTEVLRRKVFPCLLLLLTFFFFNFFYFPIFTVNYYRKTIVVELSYPLQQSCFRLSTRPEEDRSL